MLTFYPWESKNSFDRFVGKSTVDLIYKPDRMFMPPTVCGCHRQSMSVTDSCCCHRQSLSGTKSLCPPKIVCVCHKQSVSVTYSLCPSQTVFVCHITCVSVTHSLCLSKTVKKCLGDIVVWSKVTKIQKPDTATTTLKCDILVLS